jgi:hypothetical protein
MSANVDRRRLAYIEGIQLTPGTHGGLVDGACLMEAAAYVAGERWSDAPDCASDVTAALLRNLNDLLPRGPRQELKRYLPRLVGSQGTDAQENERAALAVAWLHHGPGRALPPGPAGKRLVGAAIEAARLHAPNAEPFDGQLVLPPAPRRVARPLLDAIHDLIDQLLTVTETAPTPEAAPDGQRTAPTTAPEPAPSLPPGQAGSAPVVAPGPAPTGAPGPGGAPGRQRTPRPRRPGHRVPARRGGLPPTLPDTLPPTLQRTDT